MERVGTPCFSRSSFDKGADMMILRADEGAEKWAFLDFLREEAIPDT